ncbi:MAG: bacteriophage CI repressor, partial [Endozoicomonadaceae bacterium]|nr:bacteriophage CI repressor [Endozoicomonadaceae bacterium]
TGVPLDYLCFGHGKGVPDIFKNTNMNSEQDEVVERIQSEYSVQKSELLPTISINVIHNGGLLKTEEFAVDGQFHSRFRITADDFAIEQSGDLLFVNTHQKVITKGDYLFSINGSHQIGELRQLPDGNIYFYDDDKYLVDTTSTVIHGKVVSVLSGK